MEITLKQERVERKRLRVLALMEANSVTGPAKNLIEFCQRARPHAEVSIATFQRGVTTPNDFIRAVLSAGIDIDIIKERHALDLRVIAQVRQIVAARAPDILQSHNPKSHFFVRFTGLHKGLPWIAFHHGYTWPNLKMRLYNQVNRWSLPAARRVVTVCTPFARELESTGVKPERILVRHNTVETFRPAPPDTVLALRRRLAIPAGAVVIFSAGRLSPEKGHLDLVEALARIRRCEPTLCFRVVLAGDGPERKRIEQACTRLDLTRFVILVGHESDLAPYYSMADMFVLQSHSEGSPNVLLEAMAAGLPVVATRVGGVPEIVANDEIGLLVPSRDPASLAVALSRLLQDQNLRNRFGARAKEAALQYRPDVYSRWMLNLYGSLAEDHAPLVCQEEQG